MTGTRIPLRCFRRPRLAACGLRALGLGVAAFALWPVGFRANAHPVAAVGTFIGILAVVALNALGAARATRHRSATATSTG